MHNRIVQPQEGYTIHWGYTKQFSPLTAADLEKDLVTFNEMVVVSHDISCDLRYQHPPADDRIIIHYTSMTEEMFTFDEAMSFALCAIGKEGLKLKPEQLQAICHVSDGDVFLWLPTGFGKSECYETLPICSTTRNEAVLAVVLLTVV